MTRNTLIAAALCSALILYGCGGGGGSSQNARPSILPALPLQGVEHARQAPIVDLNGTLHVGADVAPGTRDLTPALQLRGVSISQGNVADGIGASQLIAYLQEDAEENAFEAIPEGYLARFGAAPPAVLVAAGTTPELLGDVVRAIQLINAALPANWQLRLSAFSSPAGLDLDEVPDGEIHVEFAPHGDWPSRITDDSEEGGCAVAVGCASRRWSDGIRTNDPENPWVFEYAAAKAWIDHTETSGTDRLETVVHEIIHTLGRGHPSPARFPDTIMRIEDATGRTTGAEGVPGHMLHPLDREAMLAVYGWLEPGDKPATIANELGPWASTSLHIRGDIDAVDGAAFGVAVRNGLSQPWARGPTPWTNLADNPDLLGTVSWEGALIGFDRQTGDHVGADADLDLDLGTLAGDLDFTSMRAWETADLFGSGTGAVWGDGDLSYAIGVRGNTFVQTGGDDGIVTGIFVGARHEGMAGTLQRADLAAAFGGSR